MIEVQVYHSVRELDVGHTIFDPVHLWILCGVCDYLSIHQVVVLVPVC